MRFTFITNNTESAILYCLGALVIIIKIITLTEFGFQYTGSDDLIFWLTTIDYSNGIFHEPFFYGQDYNYAFESIVSIPLVLIGVPIYIALPIMSSLVGVFPFFLFSIILFRNGYSINSYIFLLIPLTLPIEYDIITSITRGFTSGLFFCSFLIFPLLNPSTRRSFIILGLSVSIGYIINPNSLIFSFPVYLYLLFINYNKPAFYIIGLVTSIPVLFIQYVSKQFYVNYPDFLIHSMWTLNYDFDRMIEGIYHLDKFFRYLTPIFWLGNWIVILAITILGIIVIKTNWKKGLSILLSIVFIVILLGVNKINDDIGVIFLSSTRMFLAIPLFLGLAFFWTKSNFVNEKKWQLVILTIAISVFLVKVSSYSSVLNKHTEKTNYGPIAIIKLDDLIDDCAELKQITTKYDVDFVVFIASHERNEPSMQFYNYGCSVIDKSTFSSIMNVYERRTWVFQQEKNNVRKKLLLFNQDLDQIEEYSKVLDLEVVNRNPNLILLKNNNKTLMELSKIFGFKLKKDTY